MDYYNEFYHHGIKGQKWGVRRYQNEDGTLTPAGQKRYARIGASLEFRGNAYSYKANRALKKQQKLQARRIDEWNKSDRKIGAEMSEQEKILYTKYVHNKGMADKMYDIRATAVKDLSYEQIQNGRRYVAASPVIGQILAGPIGAGVAAGINESRANKYIKEHGEWEHKR